MARVALVTCLAVLANVASADEPCTAIGCERPECNDCNGLDCNSFRSFIGDGICDDGSDQMGYHFDFMCEDFNYDNGDCATHASTDSATFDCADCNGRDCTGKLDSLGDGFCDAWFDLSFNCAEYNFDEGDCGDAQTSTLECADCNGIDCTYYDQYVGDGYCDDGHSFHGHQMFDFNCAKFNMDNGDCDRTTTTTTTTSAAPRRPSEVVDCDGSWSTWSQCSMACSTGVRKRTFHVRTAVQNGGQQCAYDDGTVVQAECNTHECESSACPASCSTCWEPGDGKCHTGRNHDTEAECLAHGDAGEYVWCDDPTDHCAGVWSEWSQCDSTCGGGVKYKFFTVQYCGCDSFVYGASVSDASYCVRDADDDDDNSATQCAPLDVGQLTTTTSRDDDDDRGDDDDDDSCPSGWSQCDTGRDDRRALSAAGLFGDAKLFRRSLQTARGLKRDDRGDDDDRGGDDDDDAGNGLDCSSVDGRYVVVTCNYQSCPVTEYDCDGRDASGHLSWVGDGVCDDGTQTTGAVLNFDCDDYNSDGGDCVQECEDCNGNDCFGLRSRQGDGVCDNDSQNGLNFYCAAWRYDLLDCQNEEQCEDCDGNDCSAITNFIGDGFCDEADGSNFDCEAWNFDEGDCVRDCDGKRCQSQHRAGRVR